MPLPLGGWFLLMSGGIGGNATLARCGRRLGAPTRTYKNGLWFHAIMWDTGGAGGMSTVSSRHRSENLDGPDGSRVIGVGSDAGSVPEAVFDIGSVGLRAEPCLDQSPCGVGSGGDAVHIFAEDTRASQLMGTGEPVLKSFMVVFPFRRDLGRVFPRQRIEPRISRERAAFHRCPGLIDIGVDPVFHAMPGD
jgi:hypothetical protein